MRVSGPTDSEVEKTLMPIVPATTRSAVPTTGSSAAVPGNGVVSEMANAPMSTKPVPRSPSPTARPWGSRRMAGTPNASNAPTANSHARVGAR